MTGQLVKNFKQREDKPEVDICPVHFQVKSVGKFQPGCYHSSLVVAGPLQCYLQNETRQAITKVTRSASNHNAKQKRKDKMLIINKQIKFWRDTKKYFIINH